MTIEEQMKMIYKLLNSFVKPEFPEIYEIKIEDMVYFVGIDILVDGTDEEQEMEIEMAVLNILQYTGEKIPFGITFHVENWDWNKEN
jgi:hypothetical protein